MTGSVMDNEIQSFPGRVSGERKSKAKAKAREKGLKKLGVSRNKG